MGERSGLVSESLSQDLPVEEEDDDEITVLPISIADSDGPLWRRWDTLWIKDHSRNTVSYP